MPYLSFSFALKMKAIISFTSPTTTKNTPNFKSMLFTRLWVCVIFFIGGGLIARLSVRAFALTYVLTDYDKYYAYD
jgi:hypothetical protein